MRTCFTCKNFWINHGNDDDYARLMCEKDRYDVPSYADGEVLDATIKQANTCPDYKHEDEPDAGV